MKDDDLEPMDDALAALLRRGSPRVEAPPDVTARAHDRLMGALAAPARAPAPPAPAPPSIPGPLARGMLTPLLVGFALGGGAGVAVTRALTPPPQDRIVYVDRVVPTTPAVSETPPAPSSSATPPEPLPEKRTAPVASVGTSLLVERRLVDSARAAFTAGDYDACLARLDEHARRHPEGRLAEEREALAVRALAAFGRGAEAKERGLRFLQAHPDSLMEPVVRDVLRGL